MYNKLTRRAWRPGTAKTVTLIAIALLSSGNAVAHHCKGQHANDPGCDDGGGNGGGGSDVIDLMTVFNCPTGASRDCPDNVNPSRFQADAANSPYVDGNDNVRNRFNSSGGFVLTMHEKQNKIGTRKVWWSFPTTVQLETGDTADGTDDLDDLLGFDHKTVIQVGKFTDLDLGALDPGEVAPNVDMLLDLTIVTGRRSSEPLWVRYSPTANGQCPGPRANSGVTVTRTDDGMGGARTWEIEVAAGSTACLYNSTTDYGDFDFGPLVLMLTEKL